MMHAVDLTLARPDNLGQVRPLADGYGVGEMVPSVPVPEGEVVVLDRRGPLGGEVLPERPAPREVDQLQSATHTKHGLVVPHRPFGEKAVDTVAGRIAPARGRLAGPAA